LVTEVTSVTVTPVKAVTAVMMNIHVVRTPKEIAELLTETMIHLAVIDGIAVTHHQCCFCGRTDRSIVEHRGPHNLYSLSRLLQRESVSPGQRSARKIQLKLQNFEEIIRKHGDSIRHGRFGPQVLDPKSGLWHHFNDRGRIGKKGETWVDSTSKKGKKLRGRCPKTCRICHGCFPGCFLKKRDMERRQITEEYEEKLQTLKSKNTLLLRKIYMIRMLSFVKHQFWTMSSMFQNYRFPVEIVSSRNHWFSLDDIFETVSHQNQRFSLYDIGEIVKEKDWRWR